jgi:hypothetical protein
MVSLTEVPHGNSQILLSDLAITIGINQREGFFELFDPGRTVLSARAPIIEQYLNTTDCCGLNNWKTPPLASLGCLPLRWRAAAPGERCEWLTEVEDGRPRPSDCFGEPYKLPISLSAG